MSSERDTELKGQELDEPCVNMMRSSWRDEMGIKKLLEKILR